MLKFFHKIRLLLKKKALNKCVYKKCKILQVHFTNIRIGTIKKKKKPFIAPLQKKVGQTMVMFSSNQLK